jgi:hypothetical protein
MQSFSSEIYDFNKCHDECSVLEAPYVSIWTALGKKQNCNTMHISPRAICFYFTHQTAFQIVWLYEILPIFDTRKQIRSASTMVRDCITKASLHSRTIRSMDIAKEPIPLSQMSHSVKLYVEWKRDTDRGRNSYETEKLNRWGIF